MSVFVGSKIALAYGVDSEAKCKCGMYARVVHCIECGSTQCYYVRRAAPSVLLPGERTPTVVRGFRCKLCGTTFAESDVVSGACHAQTRWRKQSEGAVAKSSHPVLPEYDGMSYEERKQAVFAKLGKIPVSVGKSIVEQEIENRKKLLKKE
jgi:hypothetical protein